MIFFLKSYMGNNNAFFVSVFKRLGLLYAPHRKMAHWFLQRRFSALEQRLWPPYWLLEWVSHIQWQHTLRGKFVWTVIMLKSVLMKEKNVCITCRTKYVLNTDLCMYESQKTSVTELLVLYKNWSSRFLLLVFANFNYPREAFSPHYL